LNRPFIDYLGALPQERIPTVINACDVMCIPYRVTELASTCNPCKLSEYIFCGVPVVASAISNVLDYLPVSRERCYTPGNAQALADRIMQQLNDPLPEPPDDSLTWETIGKRYLKALLPLSQ
jgi:glycosyltransferase involved in cell wall biosynthesis